MTEKLGQDDRGDIALVGKLGKHRYRRASARILEIDSVHQVAGNSHGVGNNKEPFQPLMESVSLLDVQG